MKLPLVASSKIRYYPETTLTLSSEHKAALQTDDGIGDLLYAFLAPSDVDLNIYSTTHEHGAGSHLSAPMPSVCIHERASTRYVKQCLC